MSFPCTFSQFSTIQWAPMSTAHSSSPQLTLAPQSDLYYPQLVTPVTAASQTITLNTLPLYYSSAIANPMLDTTQPIQTAPQISLVNAQSNTWTFSEAANTTNSVTVSSPVSPPSGSSPSPTTLAFPCNLCPKSFNRKNSLRRHLQLHSGVRPYSCSTCKRSFSRQDIYKRHCSSRRCQRLTERESIYRMGFEGANLNHAPQDVLDRCRNGNWLDHHDPNSDPTLNQSSLFYNTR